MTTAGVALTAALLVHAALTCRQQLNASLAASSGGKLSLNDFVIKVRFACLDFNA